MVLSLLMFPAAPLGSWHLLFTLKGVIVAGNSHGDCGGPGPLTSNGSNLDGDGSCAFSHAGDKSATDPLLGLADNCRHIQVDYRRRALKVETLRHDIRAQRNLSALV